MRRLASIALLVAAAVGSAGAQSLPNLPRATVATGLNDSTLVMVADSARRTRAARALDFRAMLSLRAFDSLMTSNLRVNGAVTLTGATITGAPTWSSTQSLNTSGTSGGLTGSPAITVSSCTGCGGGGGATVSDTVRAVTFDSVRAVRVRADTIRSRAGASTKVVLQGTDAGSTLRLSLVAIDSQVQSPNGRTGKPSIAFVNATTSGMFWSGSKVAIANGGAWNFEVGATTARSFVPHSFNDGTAAAPGINWGGLTNTGLFRTGTDVGIATGGVATLTVSGGAAAVLTGGAGNMTTQCGTGNSRTCTFQTTNSSGTATTFVSGSGDTLKFGGHAIATGFTAAAATSNSICIDATSRQILENAASSCLVSSRRFKTNIQSFSLADASRIVASLRGVTFQYKIGGQKAIGVIAEEADSVDSRLAVRDSKGLVNAVNYEQITVAMLNVLQDQMRRLDKQQKQIDSLRALAIPVRKP